MKQKTEKPNDEKPPKGSMLDDDVMKVVFKGNKKLADHVFGILLEKKEISTRFVTTKEQLPNSDVLLNVHAIDKNDDHYILEVDFRSNVDFYELEEKACHVTDLLLEDIRRKGEKDPKHIYYIYLMKDDPIFDGGHRISATRVRFSPKGVVRYWPEVDFFNTDYRV